MVPVAQCAVLPPSAPLQEVIVAMSSRGHGVALFAAQDGALAGILTDGDLRRLMQRLGRGLFDATAADWITRRPFTLEPRLLAADALLAMEGHAPPLNVAPIVDAAGVCVGIVRLHDLLGGAGARR
jgi:arabinose-5-phosphate isomerase